MARGMLRRLGILALLLLCAAGAASADVQPGLTVKPIAVLAEATVVSATTLEANLDTFDTYAQEVCLVWHCVPPTLYLASAPRPGEESITVLDYAPKKGGCQCSGFHTTGAHPRAYVYAGAGGIFTWTEVFSHELGEMLVDGNGVTSVQVAHSFENGASGYESPTVFYSEEIADPVEAHPFLINGTEMADFVYPSWYVPRSHGPFDRARATAAPLTLLELGYQAEFLYGQWKIVFGPGVRLPRQRG